MGLDLGKGADEPAAALGDDQRQLLVGEGVHDQHTAVAHAGGSCPLGRRPARAKRSNSLSAVWLLARLAGRVAEALPRRLGQAVACLACLDLPRTRVSSGSRQKLIDDEELPGRRALRPQAGGVAEAEVDAAPGAPVGDDRDLGDVTLEAEKRLKKTPSG